MRRALLVVALLLPLMTTNADAETLDWAPGGSVSPTYTLPLHVIDSVRGTLPTIEKRREWSQELRRALDGWDLPYTITRQQESAQPFIANDVNVSTYGCDPLITPNAITLVRARFASGGDNAGWSDLSQGGIAFLSPWRGWWDGTGNVSSTVAHEFGHTIGFGHGGTGVMSGAYLPNAQERSLARGYYLPQGG